MKKLWKIIIYVAVAAIIFVMIAVIAGQRRHVVTLKNQVAEQSLIIDSLLKRKTYSFDVKLNVTDRSNNKIYGRYNKGTIEMPSVKTYLLEIDSTNIIIK